MWGFLCLKEFLQNFELNERYNGDLALLIKGDNENLGS